MIQKLLYSYIHITIGILFAGIALGVPLLTATAQTDFSFEKNLVPTDQAEDVSKLQEILEAEGLYCQGCQVTGYFGYWTQAGLMNLQEKYSLGITGVVDEETRVKLNELVGFVGGEQEPLLTPEIPVPSEVVVNTQINQVEPATLFLAVQELESQIIEIQEQIVELTQQLIMFLESDSTATAQTDFSFEKNLVPTDQAEDVSKLQEILEAEGLYCQGCQVTGYFGYWTQAGLMNLQEKYSLGITGVVDEETRVKLNELVGLIESQGKTALKEGEQSLSESEESVLPVEDSVPVDPKVPVITLIGEATVIIEQGETYEDAGATAIDIIDGDITESIITDNQVDTAILGTYEITYNVSNQAEDVAISVVRIAEVVAQIVTGGGGDSPSPTPTPSPPAVDDTIFPSTITDLTASNPTSSSIALSWTAPGDDGSTGTATRYDVLYSSSPITSTNWRFAAFAINEPTPQVAGTSQSMVVSALSSNSTYYFIIRAADEALNGSVSYNIVSLATLPRDTMSPSATTDLSADDSTSSSITFSWTASGDDGDTGTATSYDLRYATSNIMDIEWADATQASGEPTPQEAGSLETFTVLGLSSDTNYYFAIKTSDEDLNSSSISNVVKVRTGIIETSPPPTIVDLVASNPTTSSLDLSWTVTGDSVGTSYDIRYSTTWINSENWVSATQVINVPSLQAPASSQTFTVPGLSAGTVYSFRMKVIDEDGNISDLSNGVNAETSLPPASPPPPPSCGNINTGTQVYFASTSNQPKIIQVSLAPQDVQSGASQTVTVTAQDTNSNSITQMEGIATIDSGSIEFSLSLVAGDDLDGTWEGSWSPTASICLIYEIEITATSASGQSTVNIAVL